MPRIYTPTGVVQWSTVNAPKPLSGICEGFSYKIAKQVAEHMGEADLAAVVLHGRKGELSFSCTPAASVDTLGVRAGSELSLTGFAPAAAGKVIVTQSSARWQRGQPLQLEAQAVHYPALSASGTGTITTAGISWDHPDANGGVQSRPVGVLSWGTASMVSPLASQQGLMQSVALSESVQVQEEEGIEGEIAAVVVYGYKATASLEVLTAVTALPEPGETINFGGGGRVDVHLVRGAVAEAGHAHGDDRGAVGARGDR